MRLQEGSQIYIARKRTDGAGYAKGAQILRSFYSHTGDVSLEAIRQRQVLTFLDGPLTSTVTWRSKYFVLRGFFQYWMARNEITAPPMPVARPPVAQTFTPYIYSRTEIRRLLAGTRISQKRDACKIEARTLRTFLLFLYGTGALVGEARRLERKDVDFRRRRITIRGIRFSRKREIPIGPDLYKILRTYHMTKLAKKHTTRLHFFINCDGEQLNEVTLAKTFQRLRRIAKIARHDGARYQPRLHDLRHTFAVHRLTSWFKHGADLNRMIPALSAYIGQVGLGSTQRYLSMTPERFRDQLNKLSPKRGKRRWREDAALMRFVDSL